MKAKKSDAAAEKRLGSMNPDEIAELKQLIEFLKDNNIGEFDLERGDLKIQLKFAGSGTGAALDLSQFAQLLGSVQAASGQASSGQTSGSAGSMQPAAVAHAHPASPAGSSSPASPAAPSAADDDEAGLHMVKSPIVGTFYEAAAPGSPAFVKPGDVVENGQVLCIVEAMKLMNEIESDAAGEIVKRFVSNGQPVEYGQRLYSVRPR